VFLCGNEIFNSKNHLIGSKKELDILGTLAAEGSTLALTFDRG
jgi:hypothetical protein